MVLLSKLFGRLKPDERDINKLIFDLAEHGARTNDVKELYRRFASMELFGKIVGASFPLKDGVKLVVAQGEILTTQYTTLPGGQKMAQFFVDKSDARLLPEFFGMTAREAFEMVLKVVDVDGLMLYTPQDFWFAMLKAEVERVLREEIASS